MFSETDVIANRDGQVTERQIFVLEARYNKEIWSTILVIVLVASFVFLATKYSLFFAAVCAIGLVIWRLPTLRRMSADVTHPEVTSSTALIKLDVNVRHGKTTTVDYALKIDDMTLAIDKETLLALHNDEPYTVYYTRRNNTFLSAEPAMLPLLKEKPKRKLEAEAISIS